MLQELLAAVRGGVGNAVLIEGEQGIGKSALLRTALTSEAIAGDLQVGWAVGDALGQRFPLRLMAECLSVAGGDREAAGTVEVWTGHSHEVPDEVAGFSGNPVLAGIEKLLVLADRLCAAGPLVVVAEDLQWADEASLLVWRRLCRAAGQLPLLVAGSCRPGATEAAGLQREVLAANGQVVLLSSLAGPEVAELVQHLVGAPPGPDLTRVLDRAGGNPLYARELADSLVRAGRVQVQAGTAELAGGPDGVPVSLAAVIAERLDALDEETVSVLRWAAVLGVEFSVGDLQVVSGRTAGDLIGVVAQAMAGQVVREARPRLVFRHGLIRQVLYDGIPLSLRHALHRDAARALAEVGAPPERVAAQLIAARAELLADAETEQAWVRHWLAEAAPVLIYRAPRVAAELLRRVLAGLAADDPDRAGLEAALLTAAFLLVEDQEVARVGLPALVRERDPDRAAEVAWLVGYSLLRTGRAAEAADVAVAALERPGLSDARAARVRALHAMILLALGDWDQAGEVVRQALAGAELADDRFAAGYALNVLSNLQDESARLGPIDRALGLIGESPPTTDLRLMLLANRASALDNLDRQDEAIATARQALALAEQAGTPRLGMIRYVLADQCFDVGRWDDALIELESATSLPGPIQSLVLIHGLCALIAGHRGDRETALAHLRAAPDQDLRDATALANSGYLLLARALIAELAGQPEKAAAELARCLQPGMVYDQHLLLPTLMRLSLATGDVATATAAAEAAQQVGREPLPRATAAADHCRGLLTGDPGPVLAVAEYHKAAGRPWYRAEALENAAVLAAQGGDLPMARRSLTAAMGIYLAAGAEWDLRRARDRLRPYGIRRAGGPYRSYPTTGWQALTPTETKVARLVAAGGSNPEIAAELFLSRNTVQTHVAHILAKLGARSRTEIVRQALLQPAAGDRGAP